MYVSLHLKFLKLSYIFEGFPKLEKQIFKNLKYVGIFKNFENL
jgi:hypothetical protein